MERRRGRAMAMTAIVLLAHLLGPRSTSFAQDPDANEKTYCVREGGFPGEGYAESDYPDCVWVDRIEDVPAGSTWLPSHGGIDDPEAIRRYWCLDFPGDPPQPESVGPPCRRFFAEEYGGAYAGSAASRVEMPSLDLPALKIEVAPEGAWLRLPALDLPLGGSGSTASASVG